MRRDWVEVVLPFARGEFPELRALVLVVLFAWLTALAWLWLARPRPLVAGFVALLPFAVSATVYELPQHPLRALVAGGLLLAFLFTGRAAGGGPVTAAALPRWRSRSAPAGPPCPRRRIRACCRGRRGRSRTPTTGPPSIWCGT